MCNFEVTFVPKPDPNRDPDANSMFAHLQIAQHDFEIVQTDKALATVTWIL